MSLEAVIARSRIAGGFAQHRRFTIARGRAIEKMRRFALPDPHDYALEFVQAAIANGAWHVSLALERDECMISYIGGGLREHELARLFDFLFASKDRTDIEHVRGLALGINAALLFAPKSVVIESGDGTAAGTTRMVLDPTHDRVDIGRADRPLDGTFVVLRGMNRKALPHPVPWSGRAPETGRLEERCLAAPVPIIVNGEPLFGFTSQRRPGLFGYKKVLSFDEGELYGTIGLDPFFENHGFCLLTRGVAIQTRAYDLIPGQKIGGVVCFDRLRKTVDHAAIVDDDRLQELWSRLRQYAEALVHGRMDTASAVRLLGHGELDAARLCELLRTVPRVIVAEPAAIEDPDGLRRATAIGRALEAPVLVARATQHEWLSVLSGRRVRLVAPDLGSDDDMIFYGCAPARPPATPWVTSPIEVAPEPAADVIAAMGLQGDDAKRAAAILGHSSLEISAYAVETKTVAHGLDVRLWIAGREAWRGVVSHAESGHVLLVKLEDAARGRLVGDRGEGSLLQRLVAHAVRRGRTAITRLCTRALADVRKLVPGSPRARMALQAMVRSVLVRLRSVDDAPSLRFVQFGDDTPDLMTLPVFRTHAGDAIDLRRLEQIAGVTGIVLAAAPGALVPGIDPALAIEVDDDQDEQLAAWLGPAGYARIDDEVLANIDGFECRACLQSAALGARLPWMAEPPHDDDARRRHAMWFRLGLEPALAGPRAAEVRGLLQWAALQAAHDPAIADILADLPVFITDEGRAVTLREVVAGASAVRVTFAHAGLVPEASEPDAISTLACSAAVARALALHMPVRPCFDVDLAVREPPETQGLLAWVDLDDALMFGRVGLMRGGPPSILVVDADGRGSVEVHELAREFGATGVVRLRSHDADAFEAVLTQLRVALCSVMEQLRTRISDGAVEGLDCETALGQLFGFAMRSVRVGWRPDGTFVPRIHDAMAIAILQLPVFASAHGGPVGLSWVLVRFCQLVAAGESNPWPRILGELGVPPSPSLVTWLQRWPIPMPPPRPVVGRPDTPPSMTSRDAFAETIGYWLARLRPDNLLERPAEIELLDGGRDGPLLQGVTSEIIVNESHPVIARALEHRDDPELLAWALLAIYAEINAVLEPVLNIHELGFQQRLVEVLLAGELRSFPDRVQ